MSNYAYSNYFNFGADEKYIGEQATEILNFYKGVLPLVRKNITLSTKCRMQDDEEICIFYVSVVILEPNEYLGKDTGETAFELASGHGENINEALTEILDNIQYHKGLKNAK